MDGGSLQFTNRFVAGAAKSGVARKLSDYAYGVPFGKTELGLKQVAGVVGLKLEGKVVEAFTAELHWVSLVWLAWAVAMVSKTLRVPKP